MAALTFGHTRDATRRQCYLGGNHRRPAEGQVGGHEPLAALLSLPGQEKGPRPRMRREAPRPRHLVHVWLVLVVDVQAVLACSLTYSSRQHEQRAASRTHLLH